MVRRGGRDGLCGLRGGGGGPAPAQDFGRERGRQHPLHRVRGRFPAPVGAGLQPRSRRPVHARRFRASGFVLLSGRGRRSRHLTVAVRRHCTARQEPRPAFPGPCSATPPGARRAGSGGQVCESAALRTAADAERNRSRARRLRVRLLRGPLPGPRPSHRRRHRSSRRRRHRPSRLPPNHQPGPRPAAESRASPPGGEVQHRSFRRKAAQEFSSEVSRPVFPWGGIRTRGRVGPGYVLAAALVG